jgi:hypothetical protein
MKVKAEYTTFEELVQESITNFEEVKSRGA